MRCKQIVASWFETLVYIEEWLKTYNKQGELAKNPRIKIEKEKHTLSTNDLIKAIYEMNQANNGSFSDLPEALSSELYEAIKKIGDQLLKVVSSTQTVNINESQSVNTRNSNEDKILKLLQYKETIANNIKLFVNCFNELEERERVTLIGKYLDKKYDVDINYINLTSIRTIKRIRELATIKLVDEIALESYTQASAFI